MYRHYLIAILLLSSAFVSRALANPTTAPSDRDALLAEIKTDEEAVQTITAELKQDEKDAADAEALANHPPADLTGDKKTAYIDDKKNQAQNRSRCCKRCARAIGRSQKKSGRSQGKISAHHGQVSQNLNGVPVHDRSANHQTG